MHYIRFTQWVGKNPDPTVKITLLVNMHLVREIRPSPNTNMTILYFTDAESVNVNEDLDYILARLPAGTAE